MRFGKLKSKEVVALNRGSWNSMPIHDMHVDINLVRCRKRLFGEAKDKRVLYIGFGEGANLLYLIKEGFVCSGTEIAKNRLKIVQEKIKKINKKADLRLVDSNSLPFNDNSFDIVLAWQSIYYNNQLGYREILAEILRVLKPGGQFLCSTLSVKHSLCGKRLSAHEFRPNIALQKNCIIYAFKNHQEIKKMFRKFKNVRIGYYSSSLFKTVDFHYVIFCQKPGIL